MENNNSEEVNLMIRSKQILEQIPEEEQSFEYKKMVQMIRNFLVLNCQHNMIMDYVDISQEHSVQIVYCKWCFENT
jgi:hypothetical protein